LDIIALEKQKRQERLEKLKLNLIKLAYGIFLTYSLLGHIDVFSTPLKLSTYVAIAILIINFIIQYNKNPDESFVIYALLMGLALINAYFCEEYVFFKLMIFAGSMKTIGFKKIIKFDMKMRIVLIIIVYVLCTVGIAPASVHMDSGNLRRSMGFTNPNALGIAVFGLICDILYSYDFKLNFKITAAVSGITLWMFAVARCRTAAFAIVVLVLVAFLYNKIPQFFKSKFFKCVCYITPIFLTIFTFLATYLYIHGYDIAMQINKLLSGRVKSIVNFVEILEPKLLGQPIHKILPYTLDNTFAFVLYDLGILVFVLFFVFYIRTVKNNFKYNNIHLVIIMLAFMCYGLSEHLWIFVDYNIFILAFAYNPGNEFRLDDNDVKDAKNHEENKYTASAISKRYFKNQKSYNKYLNKYLKEKKQ